MENSERTAASSGFSATTELKVSCTQTPPERMGASANRTRTQLPSRRSSSEVSVRRRTSPVVVHSMNLSMHEIAL